MRNPFKRKSIQNKSPPGMSPQDSDQKQQYTQYRLSRIIILGAFVFIAGMLIIHYVTVNYVLVNNNHNDTATKNILEQVNASNQTIFNILLPIFGAWVGVVVAFYFGSEQARKAQEALVKVMSTEEEKLAAVKVNALLERFPGTQQPHTVTLQDNIGHILDVFKVTEGLSDVLVVGLDDTPLGVLYKVELLSILPPLNATGDLGDDVINGQLLSSRLSEINNNLLIPRIITWSERLAIASVFTESRCLRS